jgi:thymidylate synthase
MTDTSWYDNVSPPITPQITNFEELQYLQLLGKLLTHAEDPRNLIPDRTGTGRYGMFGAQMRFNLRGGRMPLLTTKKVFFKGIIHELLWLISGSTNIKYLTENNVHIWDAWANDFGELGPVYGKQWRRWESSELEGQPCTQDDDEPFFSLDDIYVDNQTTIRGKPIDQLANVIEELKTNKFSTRHIVTAWNPSDLPFQALPPCHSFFQFDVNTKNELSCQMYQRSADMVLGVPFNIASYALLTHLICSVTGYTPGDFIHTLGNYHIYSNHIDAVRQQLGRKPMAFPTVSITKQTSIDDFTFDHIKLNDYSSHSAISAPVSK